ncbi:MAG TPA: signal peptide peptidase SppA [Stellaceae bacterium]|jgi:protease-4|nr:signal peptide peptidase SppA [Stellaceae bacterium]
MRRFIVGFFAVIGALVSVIIAALVVLAIWGSPASTPVAEGTVLSLNLTEGLSDTAPREGLSALLGESKATLRDVLDAIERAGNDPRVKGVFARVGGDDIPTAQAQELRDAIAALRAKGKFAIAYADTLGEFGAGTHAYYLAAGFDEIWLQPQGVVGLSGLRAEVPFFRGLLDKLAIAPSFDHREEYKTAMNSITEQQMTPPHREETESILQSVYGEIVRGVAKDRKLEEAQLRSLVDRGMLLPDEAISAHLIDHTGYRDEAEKAAKTRAGKGAALVTALNYLDRAGRPHEKGPTIALIYGTGLIQRGSSTTNPFSASGLMGADTVSRAFDKAAGDGEVKAILFRVDSPGGSAVASETIWRAVLRAHQSGKPVIVSMGAVAGSGGYYIAAPADKIVAEPATLTGSIGVLAGKFVLSGLFEKLGIGWGAVQEGASADMFSTLKDFSPPEKQRFEEFLDAAYGTFKDRVAQGRKLSADAVETVAKGRVWTGEDAKARGLVDELGGFSTALRVAKQAAKIADDQDVSLKLYPRAETVGETLGRLLGRRPPDEDTTGADALSQRIAQFRALLGQMELASQPAGAALMPRATAP